VGPGVVIFPGNVGPDDGFGGASGYIEMNAYKPLMIHDITTPPIQLS
jgi:hypothetical protein